MSRNKSLRDELVAAVNARLCQPHSTDPDDIAQVVVDAVLERQSTLSLTFLRNPEPDKARRTGSGVRRFRAADEGDRFLMVRVGDRFTPDAVMDRVVDAILAALASEGKAP